MQGDPIPPPPPPSPPPTSNSFTATIQEMFKNVHQDEKGIDIDGEKPSDLKLADDVALKLQKTRNIWNSS